ncbi:hypothetical protein [Clostridium sp.]|uniref:hypothetical protein n=1 Tax=Clostridium sp. TaxID=1506 RepID=UPI001A414C94|nr:hypothetical protein [Clostridium sp.]MBK5243172.1 hypothetical protein [Clostridium sp.]
MKKNLQAFSIAFLGFCIVLSSWFISESLKTNNNDEAKLPQLIQNSNRYEFIPISGNYDVIFDKQTGDYWGNLNGGEGDWKKNTPISNQTK